MDRVPAGTAPVLSSATLSGHPVSRLITAEPRVAYVHRVAVSVYVGREPGERSLFGSVRIDRASGAACPDSCAQTAVRIDSADLRSNAVSARHPHLSSVNLTVNCTYGTGVHKRTPAHGRTVHPPPRPTGAHRSALPLVRTVDRHDRHGGRYTRGPGARPPARPISIICHRPNYGNYGAQSAHRPFTVLTVLTAPNRPIGIAQSAKLLMLQ